MCRAHGVELPAAALRYPLLDPRVVAVVAGATTPAQVHQNLARLTADIPAALWDDLISSTIGAPGRRGRSCWSRCG
ncbi:aldo/keto reductase [Kribbella sp. NPDC059898]|uniref:aldo/keto reductase n=1 Tax=Kribbella sp. NPDC059898 TaxID=3346995 RepID=UPI003664410C